MSYSILIFNDVKDITFCTISSLQIEVQIHVTLIPRHVKMLLNTLNPVVPFIAPKPNTNFTTVFEC
jgi:hypothetical protein